MITKPVGTGILIDIRGTGGVDIFGSGMALACAGG